MSLLQLSLRTMLWILFAAAILTGWGWERWNCVAQINEYERHIWFTVRPRSEGATKDSLERRATLDRLANLSDDELRKELVGTEVRNAWPGIYDLWLGEMVRRKMVPELKAELDAIAKAPNGPHENALHLTALCRAEGKPDPVKIDVKFVVRGWPNDPKDLLSVEGIVRNADVDHRSFIYQGGCDDRGGRHERWRVELRDEHGERLPDSNFLPTMGGGIGTHGPLQYGETCNWRYVMNPRDYTRPPQSGRYQLQLIHADACIAEVSDLTGIFVWKSEPIWVEVVNREESTMDYTLIRLVLVAVLAIGVVITTRAFSAPAAEEQTWFARWGDVACCVVVIGLAIGWWFDVRQLNHSLAQLRPDSDVDWTIVAPTQKSDESGGPKEMTKK